MFSDLNLEHFETDDVSWQSTETLSSTASDTNQQHVTTWLSNHTDYTSHCLERNQNGSTVRSFSLVNWHRIPSTLSKTKCTFLTTYIFFFSTTSFLRRQCLYKMFIHRELGITIMSAPNFSGGGMVGWWAVLVRFYQFNLYRCKHHRPLYSRALRDFWFAVSPPL